MTADRQGGVVARQQLVALGLSAAAIDHRLRAGRLHSVHRGVYSVGHRVLGPVGRWWAAVLACGDGAVLAGLSAAAAFAIRPSASPTIHVLVGRSGRERRDGIRLHWCRSLPPDEVSDLNGLPITTPARTLLDLAAGGVRGRRLESAIDRAERQRLLDFADLHQLLARYPGRPGTPSLAGKVRSGCRGLLERDVVSEAFELFDEALGLAFGVAVGEVVGSEVAVGLAGAEHVPDRADQ